jgi:hypothetical protein
MYAELLNDLQRNGPQEIFEVQFDDYRSIVVDNQGRDGRSPVAAQVG